MYFLLSTVITVRFLASFFYAAAVDINIKRDMKNSHGVYEKISLTVKQFLIIIRPKQKFL